MLRRAAVPLGLLLLGALLPAASCGRPRASAGDVRTILLVTPDTLRRDRVGTYGEPTGTGLTPRLDALAARGLRFADARSPVPLTLPGHVVMMSGLPPALTGVRVNSHGRLPPAPERGFPLLAERLRDAGWRTGAFVSAAPLARRYGLDQGFEVYDDEGLDDLTGLGFPERAGLETVARALAWARSLEADERVFLWVHLFEPHAPYEGPSDLSAPRRYDLEVERVDEAVGRLLDGLDGSGRPSPVVLVASDHGEALGDLGEPTHGILLGDAVLRVPFLLAGAPGVEAGVRDDPADLADVAPTLAALAGLGWPGAGPGLPGAGRDLLAATAPPERPRVAESLYGHQRYRWAQVTAAVGPAGTLVETGAGRAWWLEPAAAGAPQTLPRPAPDDAAARALSAVIRAYKERERAEVVAGGPTAGGYGHGGRTEPFLPPEENARRPDPYRVVARAQVLDEAAHALLAGADPAALAAGLERVAAADPGNPEASFWLGRARLLQARAAATAEAAAEALSRADEALRRAWRGGRRDAGTLLLVVAATPRGGEEAMLERLRTLGREVPPDCRLAILEARLLRALGRPEEALEACRRAESLCRLEREREALERARREGTCR